MNITLLPPDRRMLTEIAFCRWLGEAAPGAILEYHRGFLALDTFGDTRSPERHALRDLARRAAWAADRRLIHLLQKRHGPRDFGYLAVKRPNPRRKAWALVHTDPMPAKPTPPNALEATLDPEACLSQTALGARWCMSPRSLERWRREGYGPRWLRLGGVVRYRLEDVRAYERARLSAPNP